MPDQRNLCKEIDFLIRFDIISIGYALKGGIVNTSSVSTFEFLFHSVPDQTTVAILYYYPYPSLIEDPNADEKISSAVVEFADMLRYLPEEIRTYAIQDPGHLRGAIVLEAKDPGNVSRQPVRTQSVSEHVRILSLGNDEAMEAVREPWHELYTFSVLSAIEAWAKLDQAHTSEVTRTRLDIDWLIHEAAQFAAKENCGFEEVVAVFNENGGNLKYFFRNRNYVYQEE
jgi:hypothetical protein